MKGELILQLDNDRQHVLVYITDENGKVRADIKVPRTNLTVALGELLTSELPPILGGENTTKKN